MPISATDEDGFSLPAWIYRDPEFFEKAMRTQRPKAGPDWLLAVASKMHEIAG